MRNLCRNFSGVLTVFILVVIVLTGMLTSGEGPAKAVPGVTVRLSYETEADILADFLSSARIYREAKPGTVLKNPLELRKLGLTDGKFGKALRIGDGWSVTRGTANESGIDLDLIVATLWGDYRTKPHYWGTGKVFGDRGTVAFWVKRASLLSDPLYPLFLQSSTGWGRKERDLLRVDVGPDGKLKALVRDVFYNNHTVETADRAWVDGEWQHVAVVFDQAYGLKLFHNGRLAASNWGDDAWWQAPIAGLFSPFLPEADYDEIVIFDYPLDDAQVGALWAANTIPEKPAARPPLDEAARKRLLLSYGDVDQLALPAVSAGRETLSLRQARIAACRDENIPAWWVMDGRYELAWPHPYRLFTFILGDVDFHGTKVDIELAPGEKANYLALEGVLDGTEAYPGTYKSFDKTRRIAGLDGYPGHFFSTKLDLGGAGALHFPMLKGFGTPEGLEDRGTLRFPLTGKVRIHEVGLWQAEATPGATALDGLDSVWTLRPAGAPSELDLRYLDAFLKLAGADSRTLFLGSKSDAPVRPFVEVAPLQPFHVFGNDLNPDPAVDRIGLSLTVIPEKTSDTLWLSLRDPANPSRLWAKAVVRLEFAEAGKPQPVNIRLEPVDLMLGAEDRLWLELRFANAEKIVTAAGSLPKLGIGYSQDREKALAAYAAWEMLPAQMQYIKEYNYQPWLFTGEQRNVSTLAFPGGPIPMTLSFISGQGQSLKFWTNFGGPYDMWYPPQAVLRHDPTHRIAGIYGRLTGERAQTYGAYSEGSFSQAQKLALAPDIPAAAPSWAVWERELYSRHQRTARWIVDQQREDGFFWGGYKDDVFIPLGYAAVPFMGDEKVRRAFLREYDGVDEVGAFKDGYCQVWPNDYLHISDILVSRGLMVPYALGDPYVLEREMITAKAFGGLMDEANAERAAQGLPKFVFTPEAAKTVPKLWGQQLMHDYERTQVLWYWGKTPSPVPHAIADRGEMARKMMTIAIGYDDTEEYGWTRAMHHTDKQGGPPGRNELITAALGGKLQGRIEPHPHSLVVSWSDPDPDIARLVSAADDTTVRFNLYNFGAGTRRMTARFWRIPDGEFTLKVGEDSDDDGLIDPGKGLLHQSKVSLRRFGTAEIEVPARRNIAVSLELVKAGKRPAALPDLAVHPVKDVKLAGDALTVTVHNIGDAPAADFTVEALDAAGKVIDRKVGRSLAAPLDFVPKTVAVTLNVPGGKYAAVVIDRGDAIAEIYEDNNAASAAVR